MGRILMLMVGLVLSGPVVAQGTPRILAPGDHVRLRLAPATDVEGMYVASTADSIQVRTGGEGVAGSAFARSAVLRVDVGERGSRMSGVGKGIAIGAITGGMVGFLATREDTCGGDATCDPLATVGRALITLGGAVMGSIVGGLAGAAVPPGWEWHAAAVPGWPPGSSVTPSPDGPRRAAAAFRPGGA